MGNKIDKLGLVVLCIRAISGMGVETIVRNAVRATTPPGLGLPRRLIIGVGQLVLQGMFVEAADKYVVGVLTKFYPEVKEKIEPQEK